MTKEVKQGGIVIRLITDNLILLIVVEFKEVSHGVKVILRR